MTKFIQIGSFLPEVNRVAALPTAAGKAALTAAFRAQAAEAKAKTHVITGDLKASHKVKIGGFGGDWSGEFRFGGGGVDYAIYEFNGIYGPGYHNDGINRYSAGNHNPMPSGNPEKEFIAILLKELAG